MLLYVFPSHVVAHASTVHYENIQATTMEIPPPIPPSSEYTDKPAMPSSTPYHTGMYRYHIYTYSYAWLHEVIACITGRSQSLPAQSRSLPQSVPLQESITAVFQCSMATPPPLARSECPRFTTLLNELSSRVAARWEDIGSSLQLEPGLLEIIRKDNPSDCRACFREMLKEWMKQVDPLPTWSAIIKAVKDCGYSILARELRRKYC